MNFTIICCTCTGAAALTIIGICLYKVIRRNRNNLTALRMVLEQALSDQHLPDKQRASSSVELAQLLLALPEAAEHAQRAHDLLSDALRLPALLDVDVHTQALILLAETHVDRNDFENGQKTLALVQPSSMTKEQQAHFNILQAWMLMQESAKRIQALALIDRALDCKNLTPLAAKRAHSLRTQLCTLISCEHE